MEKLVDNRNGLEEQELKSRILTEECIVRVYSGVDFILSNLNCL